jgi:uncharacterized protein
VSSALIGGPAGALEISIDPVSAPRALGIVCHPHPLHGGTKDNKVVTTVSKAFNDLGATVIRFNYRGVGKSEGAWDEGRGETDDAIAALKHLQSTEGADLPVLAAGFSFGGYVVRALSARQTVDKLLLVAPAVTRFAVGEVEPSTLIVHGETDDVVPLSEVLAWARPQQIPITVMPGAGHFFHGALVPLRNCVRSLCRLSQT